MMPMSSASLRLMEQWLWTARPGADWHASSISTVPTLHCRTGQLLGQAAPGAAVEPEPAFGLGSRTRHRGSCVRSRGGS